MLAVAELHVRLPLLVAAQRVRAVARGRSVQRRDLVPPNVVHAHLELRVNARRIDAGLPVRQGLVREREALEGGARPPGAEQLLHGLAVRCERDVAVHDHRLALVRLRKIRRKRQPPAAAGRQRGCDDDTFRVLLALRGLAAHEQRAAFPHLRDVDLDVEGTSGDVGDVRRLRERERLLHREDLRLARLVVEEVVVLAALELEPRDLARDGVLRPRQLGDALHPPQLSVRRPRQHDPRADDHVGMRALQVDVARAVRGERERPVAVARVARDLALERRVVTEHVEPLAQDERLRRKGGRHAPRRRAERLVPRDERAVVRRVWLDGGEHAQVPVIRQDVAQLTGEEQRVARLQVQARALEIGVRVAEDRDERHGL